MKMLMRIFTTIALCCGLLLPGMAAGSNHLSPLKTIRKMQGLKLANDAINYERYGLMKAQENITNWQPTKIKTYGWTGKKWALEDTYTCEYNYHGNLVNELCVDGDGDMVRTAYEYNENGKVVLRESTVSSDGIQFNNNKKTKFTYDPIITNVVTEREEWMWMDGDWKLVGNCYRRIIKRNEDGNVTNVVIAVPYEGRYDPIQRLKLTYGDDGKATSMTQEMLTYDGTNFFWMLAITIKDIVWENTDGQIYDCEQLFIGNNRIKTASYVYNDYTMEVNAEYNEGNENYEMNGIIVEGGDTCIVKSRYEALENNGYNVTSETVYPNGEFETSHEEMRYDEWGHMTLSYQEYGDNGGTEIEKNEVGTVELGSDDLPVSYTVATTYFDNKKQEMVTENVFREEYSDYVDVTLGIEALESETAAPVRYFNLQGMPVAAPVPGEILIKQQGKTWRKIKFKN